MTKAKSATTTKAKAATTAKSAKPADVDKSQISNQQSSAQVRVLTNMPTSGSSDPGGTSGLPSSDFSSGSANAGLPEEQRHLEAKREIPSPDNSNQEAQESQNPPIPQILVVIPYRSSMARGNELQFAVRAWERHLPDCKIAIIGDTAPWFSPELLHIPHKIKVADNPQIDVAQKMLIACESELIPDEFIWSNDDIYPVAPLHPADLFVLLATGKLGIKGAPGGKYNQNAARTLKALKAAGIPAPWDYATHTPVLFNKARLKEVIKKFKADKEGHLVSTLYFNTFFKGYRPIRVDNGATGSIVASVYRPNPDQRILKRAFEDRKYINNNDAGWKPVLPYLQKLFPKKSRFEK